MRYTGSAVLAAIILFIAGNAFGQNRTIEEIIAWVNSDIILKSEYEVRKAQIKNELSEDPPRGRGLKGAQLDQAFNDVSKRVLSDLIDEALVLQVAKDAGMSADLELIKTLERLRQEQHLDSLEALEKAIVAQGYTVDEFKQNIKTRYLISQVYQSEVYRKVVVTQEEIHKFYDAHVKDFDRPAGIRLREISVYTENRGPAEIESQRKKIEDALAAVKKGDDFGDTAAKNSESNTAPDGGDLGFFVNGECPQDIVCSRVDDLAQPLKDAVAKLDKGQVTDVIALAGGFMIIKVEDKHNGGILPFELAQKEVFDVLWQQALNPKIKEYLQKLRTDGFVKIAEGYTDVNAPSKDSKVSENKN